jgi:hypothetical protein
MTILYAVIVAPLSSGVVHDIIKLLLDNDVVTSLILSGTAEGMNVSSVENSPIP